jgi:hypothetical protein
LPVNPDLERKVILRFIQKRKRDRYLQFVSAATNRQKFIAKLAHFQDFKWELLNELNLNEQKAIAITLTNYNLTDKTCYVISENMKLDTKTMEVDDAIRSIVGYGMGSIIVFGDANAIFYQGEDQRSSYMSRLIL